MARHSGIKDGGAVFEIVPSTRKIIVPTSHFVIGTVGEHLSEQITFICPATIDGHDITACDRRYVTWRSVDGIIGHDELMDATVDGNVVSFKWNIRNGLTTAKGVVSFSVHFEDTVAGETVYKFSTTTCKSCEILETINSTIGKYEAVYVADDMLVFSDYTLVDDETATIDTNGLIPEGTLAITDNGTYDVGEYAGVYVDVNDVSPDAINLSVKHTGNGKIVAVVDVGHTSKEEFHTLSSNDDANFKAENIVEGVNIFGVMGTRKPEAPNLTTLSWHITNEYGGTIPSVGIYSQLTSSDDGTGRFPYGYGLNAYSGEDSETVPLGSIVIFNGYNTGKRYSEITHTGLRPLGIHGDLSSNGYSHPNPFFMVFQVLRESPIFTAKLVKA